MRSGGHGYAVVHWSTAIGTDAACARATVASSSVSELMPLESRSGRLVASSRSRSGAFDTSPEATFHATIPSRSSRSTASPENGELRNTRPRSSACRLRPTQCSSANSMRRQ